jgi:hypothetical protein
VSHEEEEVWARFNLEENCAQVTDENRVRLYFAQFALALRCLDRIFRQHTPRTNGEAVAVDAFVSRLVETFRLLSLKYFYPRPGEVLRIDASDSGFVHFSMLIELASDAGARDARLAQVEPEPVEALRRQMVDRIVRHQAPVRDLQERIARRLYLEGLDRDRLMDPFVAGPLVRTGKPADKTYLWSFATYDRTVNRPYFHHVYFVHDERGDLDEESAAYGELVRASHRLASGRVGLLAFANRLDDAVAAISPRIVKRLVLGPWWAPGFTENEGELGRVLDRLEGRMPFALRWETETLVSDRELRVGGGLLTRGRLKQVFWIPKEVDLSARGVSHLERFLLAPHWLGQHMAAAGLFADHRLFVIDKEGEVHGLH